MTSAIVPLARLTARSGDAVISGSVRGRTWRDLASIHHWLRGSGAVLIPAHSPQLEVDFGVTGTLAYRVEPSGRAIARVWAIEARRGSGSVNPFSRAEVEFPDGTKRRIYTTDETQRRTTVIYVEELTAKSAAAETLELSFTSAIDTPFLYIESVACWELPRAALTVGDATDRGLELDSYRAGSPIYDDTADRRSVHALVEALDGTELRRHLLQMAFAPVSMTSTTAVQVFSAPVPVVPRQLRRTRDVVPVSCAMYVRVPVGTVARFSLEESIDGNSAIVEVDGNEMGGAWTMVSLGGLDVWPEDPAQADGDSGDTVQAYMWVVSGAGTIDLAGVYLWESA